MKKFNLSTIVRFMLSPRVGYDYDTWKEKGKFPISKFKYLGVDYEDELFQSYIYSFIENNINLLSSGEDKVERYFEPKLETYNVYGEEEYTQKVGDEYVYTLPSYHGEFLRKVFTYEEFGMSSAFDIETPHIDVFDGKLIQKHEYDIFNTEITINDIKVAEGVKIEENTQSGMVYDVIICETDIKKIDSMIEILTKRRELLTKKRL